VVAVVPGIPGGRGRSLEVVAVVPDVHGDKLWSLEVVAVVTDDPAAAEFRWK